jgi:hypothetical protein
MDDETQMIRLGPCITAQTYLERSPYGTHLPTVIVTATRSHERRAIMGLLHTIAAEVFLADAANGWSVNVATPRLARGGVVEAAVHIELADGSDAEAMLGMQALADALEVLRYCDADERRGFA